MSVQDQSSRPLLVVSVPQSLSKEQYEKMLSQLAPLAMEIGAVPAIVDGGASMTLQPDFTSMIAVMARVAESVEANTRAVRDLVEQIARDDDGEVMDVDGGLSSESGYLNGR